MVKLGVLPVRSLLVMEDALWAACGGQVSVISVETHTVEVSHLKWLCSVEKPSELVQPRSRAEGQGTLLEGGELRQHLACGLCSKQIPPDGLERRINSKIPQPFSSHIHGIIVHCLPANWYKRYLKKKKKSVQCERKSESSRTCGKLVLDGKGVSSQYDKWVLQ